MTIEFQCRCGKAFHVPNELAGKRARCKACGETLVVPAKTGAPLQLVPPPTAGKPVAKKQTAVQPLAAMPAVSAPVEESSATVSNSESPARPTPPPPTIRLGLLRYWKLSPLIPALCIIGFVLLVVGSLLIGIPWLAAVGIVPLGLLAGHARGRKVLLATTTIEPGWVIRAEPPLVATFVDLGTGKSPQWNYIRISATTLPEQLRPGERLPMAVQRKRMEGNHPPDFQSQPLANLVSDSATLSAALASISETRWHDFSAAWETILEPERPGLFKVPTQPRQALPIARGTLEQILQASLGHQPASGRYLAKVGIPPPVLHAAQASYASDLAAEAILALVKCDHEATGRLSLLFTLTGLRFKVRDDLVSDVAWSDLWSAGLTGKELEIVMTTGLRMALPMQTFGKNAAHVELALALICEQP